jgi:glycogen operon protein
MADRSPGPLPEPGACALETGTRFTLWHRHATAVHLLLFLHRDDARPAREIALDPHRDRLGDLWTVFVPGVTAGQLYAWRAEAPGADAEDWILDPWARAVCPETGWGLPGSRRRGEPVRRGAPFPKAVVVRDAFDWGDDAPPRVEPGRRVIYEAHVRGFTRHPSSRVRQAGTYAGLTEKIPYLRDLGVNTLELLPLFDFDELEYFTAGDARAGLRNFWGYSTRGFFAPMAGFSADAAPAGAVAEFKRLVKTAHAAGIQVLLDVVYNHTHENGEGGPSQTFRPLDPDVFYLRAPDRHYFNFSGCGNTFNPVHPVAQDYILASLRHWVLEYRVDGFRFDLATALCRNAAGGLDPDPALLRRISEDPVLRGRLLVAEAWDAAGGYQVADFPGRDWSVWNGLFRDDVRAFWKGEAGMLSRFATRLTGSGDLYHRSGRGHPQLSVNFVTCHDGFTLRDLVSYERKRNEANLEDNRDGENHNHSFNCGAEGPTADPAIQALRLRQQKNLIASLLLAHGLPMLCAGDEFGRTQQGNNNAYCQDNEISWLDWRMLEANRDLHRFTRALLALRLAHPALHRDTFIPEEKMNGDGPAMRWLGPGGGEPDWHRGQSLGWFLSGKPVHTGSATPAPDLLLIFNAGDSPKVYALPLGDGEWVLSLATDTPEASRHLPGAHLTCPAHSVRVLLREETAAPRE